MEKWTTIDLCASTPSEEDCAQVGSRDYDYRNRAIAECRHFIKAIKIKCGKPSEGAVLRMMSNPHDFGTYYTVAVSFDPNVQEAAAYAYKVDEQAPKTWAEADLRPPTWQAARRTR